MPTILFAITLFSVTLDIHDVHDPLQWTTAEGGNGHVYQHTTPADADRLAVIQSGTPPPRSDLERGAQLFAQHESADRPPSHGAPDTHESDDDEDGPPVRIVRQDEIVEEQAEQKKVDTDKLVSTILMWAAVALGVVIFLLASLVAIIVMIDRSDKKSRDTRS